VVVGVLALVVAVVAAVAVAVMMVVAKSLLDKTPKKAAAGWHLMRSHMIPLAASPQHLEHLRNI
jgi:drug/metabolite transporter (DMT)-like permease